MARIIAALLAAVLAALTWATPASAVPSSRTRRCDSTGWQTRLWQREHLSLARCAVHATHGPFTM